MTGRVGVVAVVLAVLLTGQQANSSEIAWRKDVAAAARESASSGKPLLVMVKARWCGPCHQMLRQSFPDPAVTARVSASFIPLLVDADEQAALIQKLNINAFPTMLVLDSSQRVAERVTGFQSAAQLNARLAALQPRETLRARRPIEVAQSSRAPAPQTGPQPARKLSFHDRVWASIRASSYQDTRPGRFDNRAASPGPGLGVDPPPPRDTLSAAKAFGSGNL